MLSAEFGLEEKLLLKRSYFIGGFLYDSLGQNGQIFHIELTFLIMIKELLTSLARGVKARQG